MSRFGMQNSNYRRGEYCMVFGSVDDYIGVAIAKDRLRSLIAKIRATDFTAVSPEEYAWVVRIGRHRPEWARPVLEEFKSETRYQRHRSPVQG